VRHPLGSTVAALVPACLAALQVANVADAAHDAGVARALGLDAQPWRAIDVALASLFAALPLGTRAARAGLGASLVVAAAGVVLYGLTVRLGAACADARRFGATTAFVATCAALCGAPWQIEGAAVGGSAAGALLTLAPLALLAAADETAGGPARSKRADPNENEVPVPTRWRAVLFALGLAVGYEPLVGLCGLGASVAFVAAGPSTRRALRLAWRADARAMSAAGMAGLTPWVLAAARTRALGVPLLPALADAWAGERGASLARSPSAFVQGELGVVLGAFAVAGAVFALLSSRARPLAIALLALTCLGFAAVWVGAPAGPSRFGPTILAAVASACALAGVAMQTLVLAIARAKLPLARASAVMVVVLLVVLPVDSADSALERASSRDGEATAVWDDLAWSALPARAVVLVTDARLAIRAAAARAAGSLRGDLAVVTAFPRGRAESRALASDPALVPLWRDLELAGAPTEASLSALAAARPLAMAYEPRWGRVLGKHLVPIALLDRFESEPRGTSDRRRALEAFARKRERLARAAVHDPELASATAYLLRARLLDVAASGDRELVGRAVEDLRAFAPDDPVATAVVARVVLGHGAGRIDDLRP
jgi:hypothetical protein